MVNGFCKTCGKPRQWPSAYCVTCLAGRKHAQYVARKAASLDRPPRRRDETATRTAKLAQQTRAEKIEIRARKAEAREEARCVRAESRQRKAEELGEARRLRAEALELTKARAERIKADKAEAMRVQAEAREEAGSTAHLWRIGCTVLDWTGLTSVVRCDHCPQFARVVFGQRISFSVVDAHLRDVHGLTDVERVEL